jgi:hypothetical protein
MWRSHILLVICALALGVGATTAVSALSRAACIPGPKMIRGVHVQVFCGPATATIRLGGRTIRIRQGQCGPNVSGYFSVRVGIFTFIPSRSKYTWFAAYVGGDRGRTYRNQKVAFEYGGRHFPVWPNTVRLKAAPYAIPSGGTFAGRTNTGQSVSGSFKC